MSLIDIGSTLGSIPIRLKNIEQQRAIKLHILVQSCATNCVIYLFNKKSNRQQRNIEKCKRETFVRSWAAEPTRRRMSQRIKRRISI